MIKMEECVLDAPSSS